MSLFPKLKLQSAQPATWINKAIPDWFQSISKGGKSATRKPKDQFRIPETLLSKLKLRPFPKVARQRDPIG